MGSISSTTRAFHKVLYEGSEGLGLSVCYGS